MKKMRVFELAKELSIEARELLKIAKDLAISVENNMSMVDVHDIERIKKRVQKDTEKLEEESSQDTYVEKRVSANVIRRRARVSPPPEQEPEAAEQEKPVKEEKATEEEVIQEVQEPLEAQESEEVAPEQAKPQEEPAGEEVEEKPQEPTVEETVEPEAEIAAEKQPEPEPVEAPALEEAPAEPKKELTEEEKKEEEKEKKKKEKKKGKKGKELEEEPTEGEEVKHARLGVKKAKKPKEKEKEVYTLSDLYGSGKQAFGKKLKKKKDKRALSSTPLKKRKIRIGRSVTVLNLAKEMGIKVSDVIKTLMDLGVMATQNQYISSEDALLVASELGFDAEEARDEIKETYFSEPTFDPDEVKPRPPVVTVMGHVDHGKTSLLDAIREENVIDSESGGITQHIGAYQATCKGKLITFIDTPGHEAFTSMRSRGAQVTDFVVLVVAADDGVMDQTREAINHSRAAQIPILVAVNKIDKPNANPQRVKEQLSELGLVPEDWGGDTIFVDVSAKKHTGIEDLLEMILLQSEILDLKAYPKGAARGVVLESKLDKNRGPMSTILIQHGLMKRGDVFVVGSNWGRARAMYDFTGKPISQAGPATPLEIIGLNGLPSAGDTFFIVPNEKKAKEIISYISDNEELARQQVQEAKGQVTLEDLYSQVKEGMLKELNLIIKGDVHGTVEAIEGSVTGIDVGEEELRINVIHSAVGGITENDVLLASTSMAIIVGFNVRPEPKARDLAKKYNVEIKLYSVIYDLIEDIKQALRGMLEPVFEEVIQGRAEVRDLFKVPKIGIIAGCMVTEGAIMRGTKARLLRDNVVVHEGRVESLRRFKDDAKEVASGYECGIGLGSFNDLKVGDIIEAFSQEKVEIEPAW
ncbi:MAG TPA: translation initiation factor IF-2 [Deltaproteobacteria bacterium]|nr:translation initiation factor IF-2 [Deltaproteobacteria bacterium]